MICFKDSTVTVPELHAARVLECWSLKLLCCHCVPPAPFLAMLHCSSSLAAVLAATDRDDMFQGFPPAQHTQAVLALECWSLQLLCCSGVPPLHCTFSHCAQQQLFAGCCACAHGQR
eukprot:3442878-Rhodomonas_salina.1